MKINIKKTTNYILGYGDYFERVDSIKKRIVFIVGLIIVFTLIGSSIKETNQESVNPQFNREIKSTHIMEEYLKENKLERITNYKYINSYILYSQNDELYDISLFVLKEDINDYKLVSTHKILKDSLNKIEVINLSDDFRKYIAVCVIDNEMKDNINRIKIEFDNLSKKGLSSVEIFPISKGIAVIEQEKQEKMDFNVKSIVLKRDKKILFDSSM